MGLLQLRVLVDVTAFQLTVGWHLDVAVVLMFSVLFENIGAVPVNERNAEF